MVGRILCSRTISSSPKFHPMNEDSSFPDKKNITRFLCQLILDHLLTPEPQWSSFYFSDVPWHLGFSQWLPTCTGQGRVWTPYVGDKLIPPSMTGFLMMGNYIKPLLLGFLTIYNYKKKWEYWHQHLSHLSKCQVSVRDLRFGTMPTADMDM